MHLIAWLTAVHCHCQRLPGISAIYRRYRCQQPFVPLSNFTLDIWHHEVVLLAGNRGNRVGV